MKIRLGTRKSALALWQARHVAERMEQLSVAVELVPIVTTGDQILDRPLAQVGGKGLFLKELEEALLQKRIDAAVHSLKDVPWDLPHGLRLDAVLPREDARDALVSRDRVPLSALGPGARIGTTSLRRICQLKARRPDLCVLPLRGNVDTRLRKVGRGDVDAAILAVAGLRRLGLESEIAQVFTAEESLPAPGQGAMAIEVRHEDAGVFSALDHPATARAVRAERALLRRLGGDCQVPIGAYAWNEGDGLVCSAMVGLPDGSQILRQELRGTDPETVGTALAEQLLNRGAATILDSIVEARIG